MRFIRIAMLMFGLVVCSIGVAEAQTYSSGGTYYGAPFFWNSNLENDAACTNQSGIGIPEPTDADAIQNWTLQEGACNRFPSYCTEVLTESPTGVAQGVVYRVQGNPNDSACLGNLGIVARGVIEATGYPYDPTKNLGDPGCDCAGDPINLGTGEEYRDETDADLGA
jgi:hypothetical protein